MKTDAAIPEPPYYVKGLALGVPAYLIGIHLWTWIFFFPGAMHGHADFRQLYAAGYMVRSGYGHQLYDYNAQKAFQDALVSPEQIALPFIRPAYQALLFAPLSLLPYRAAYVVFLAVNVALLAVSFWLLRERMNHLREIFWWLPVALFLCFLPIAAALMQGQDSILLLTLLAAALVFIGKGQDLAAGLFAGLGLFKFQIVIPIAMLFFVWRRWRFTVGFVLSAIAAIAVSIWLVGIRQWGTYMRSLVSMSSGTSTQTDLLRYPVQVNYMANLHGLIFGLSSSLVKGPWIVLFTAILSTVLLLCVAVGPSRMYRGTDAMLIAIAASMLVSYYLFIHDLSALLIPIAVTLNESIRAEATGDKEGQSTARVTALMFVSPICMAFLPEHFYLVSLVLCGFLAAMVRHVRRNVSRSPDSAAKLA